MACGAVLVFDADAVLGGMAPADGSWLERFLNCCGRVAGKLEGRGKGGMLSRPGGGEALKRNGLYVTSGGTCSAMWACACWSSVLRLSSAALSFLTRARVMSLPKSERLIVRLVYIALAVKAFKEELTISVEMMALRRML